MKTVQFDIHGDVPSKKNSRKSVQVGRMRFTVPGKYHDAWHKEASREMLVHCRSLKGAPYQFAHVEIAFYPATKRRSDLSNKAESVMDLLVNAGILTDDNWYVVPCLTLRLGGVDKSNPRASVILTIYENNL